MAFGWGSSAVSVVVTVVGSDGTAPTTYYASLAVGDTTTIAVPEGTRAVTLARMPASGSASVSADKGMQTQIATEGREERNDSDCRTIRR